MGLIQELAGHPLVQELAGHPLTQQVKAQLQTLGLGSQIAIGVGAFIFLSVVYHVAGQLLFKNPNEPPMVFSWFPVVGSTITYGIDPPRFFKENRAKVSLQYPSRTPIEPRALRICKLIAPLAQNIGSSR